MAKMKISELADKLKNEGHNFESKDIIKALDELNIKNNDKKFVSASSIEDYAIDKLELLGNDFYIYKDVQTGNVNVLYKRDDGNYGLIKTR